MVKPWDMVTKMQMKMMVQSVPSFLFSGFFVNDDQMCGILAIFSSGVRPIARDRAVHLAGRLRHRGPDWSGIYVSPAPDEYGVQAIICHERLSIMDVESGSQPLYSGEEPGQRVVLGVNGEIYNHRKLRERYVQLGYRFTTHSDCEVILPAYQGIDPNVTDEWIAQLEGMFAFVLYDERDGTIVAARDHLGIIPLYMGWTLNVHGEPESLWFASEMKALSDQCDHFIEFPPGCRFDFGVPHHCFWDERNCNPAQWIRRWFEPSYLTEERLPTRAMDLAELRMLFERSVISHTMSEVPYGVLLSGGLDSSLVAAIAQRHNAELGRDPLRSFCIGLAPSNPFGSKSDGLAVASPFGSKSDGLKVSPDLIAAQKVADHIGTRHVNYTFALEEGIDALDSVIRHLETFDVTTVRASVPMFLLARKIKATGVKMVLSGEGSDELFGGYLYFHKAPNATEFHQETVRKLKALHAYDCLRANKATSAWGLEVRVPFLDRNFVEYAMSIDPKEKMVRPGPGGRSIEKWMLRAAFEGSTLPHDILWRQKEQFSDGVGYGWIDGLKAHAAKMVSDEQLRCADERFPESTPVTKEAYLYRSIFERHYPQYCATEIVLKDIGPSVACSTAAALAWDASFASASVQDPSGRSVVDVHGSDERKK